MPRATSAPADTRAPLRPLAHPADNCARLPAALRALLMALLASLAGQPALVHLLRRLIALADLAEQAGHAIQPGHAGQGARASRADFDPALGLRRLRARIGYMVSGHRNCGMRPPSPASRAAMAACLRPQRAARAPPPAPPDAVRATLRECGTTPSPAPPPIRGVPSRVHAPAFRRRSDCAPHRAPP